eukprot:600615-Rhodomonas_salina.1
MYICTACRKSDACRAFCLRRQPIYHLQVVGGNSYPRTSDRVSRPSSARNSYFKYLYVVCVAIPKGYVAPL